MASKYAHIREPAMRYFLTHTFEETRERFKLTRQELENLLCGGYRDPKLKHLRKDTRRNDPWTAGELRFLLQHARLMPQDWISAQLKRGHSRSVRGRLKVLALPSRTINGISVAQFRDAFGSDPSFYLQTTAGPGRKGSQPHVKIVPWVWLDQELSAGRLRTAPVFRELVRAMALFQDWIFEGDALEKMVRICE
jgi:hypothetical protein